MSYDLYLYRPTPGHTVLQAHEEASQREEAETREDPPKCFAPWSSQEQEEIVRAIAAADPGVEVIRPSGGDFVQLCGPEENPYDWCVAPESLTVSWTYTKSPDRLRTALDRIGRGVRAIRPMNVRAFDPQLDREIDLEHDLAEIAGAYEGVNRHLADRYGAGATDARRRPWWKFW